MKIRILMFMFVFSNISVADEIDDLLHKTSSDLNKTMSGMTIDKVTKLRNTIYLNTDKREFIYGYKITDDSLDRYSFDWAYLKKNATNSFCTNPDLKVLLDLTTITMSYTGYDGTFLHEFNFSKNDCSYSDSSKLESKSGISNYNSKSTIINLGGNKVTISSPYGFHIENDNELIKILKTMFSSGEMSIKVILSPDIDSDRFRIMMVVTLSKFEDKNISKKEFKYLSKILVEQQYTLLSTVKDRVDKVVESSIGSINDSYNLNAEASIDEMTSMGVFIDKEDAVSMAVEVKAQISMDGYSDNTPQIATMSFLRIKNRLVVAYLYSDYIDGKDIAWAKSKTNELIDLLLKANN